MRIKIKKRISGFRKLIILTVLAGTIFFLSSCTQKPLLEPSDILTQKPTSSEKIPITILVKYAFSINSFEEAVEKKFPQIDIIQVGNYTRDMGKAEYTSRLEHDDLTDIVMTWPLDVGKQYWEDRLIDLSGMNFTSKYNISILDTISDKGKLYYLPGPSQVRGIVYNKTMFEEHNWEVPKNFEEFEELCQTIEESGIRSLQLPFQNSEVLDTAFVGYSYADCFSKPVNSQWLTDYNEGKGSLRDNFLPAFDTFQTMMDAGIFKKSDLDVDYAEREKMLFTRQCAMVEDSFLMAQMGFSQTGSTDEFAIMPFFSPNADDGWARLYMVCYIGLNKHLLESENKEKYDLVLQLMEYISTSEGQAALAGDTGAMFSSLVGEAPPDTPGIEELIPVLEQGRYAVFPELRNSQNALREGLKSLLKEEMTVDEIIKKVDRKNTSWTDDIEFPKLLGTAMDDFTMIETGNFVTDAMRKQSGCEIALFLDNGKDGKYNGKGVGARLYSGDVTLTDIDRILPDLKHGETGTLWKVTMTGENLLKTLEYALPVDNNIRGWFYYFSGLRMKFDPTAQSGERVIEVTTADGSDIDLNKSYSIAVMDNTVEEEYLISCEETDILISDILIQEVQNAKSISPSGDGRFTIEMKK